MQNAPPVKHSYIAGYYYDWALLSITYGRSDVKLRIEFSINYSNCFLIQFDIEAEVIEDIKLDCCLNFNVKMTQTDDQQNATSPNEKQKGKRHDEMIQKKSLKISSTENVQ